MSVRQDIKRRVSEHPKTLPGLVTGFVLTVVLALGLRTVTGVFLDDPVFEITYVALLGGGFGATAMYGFHRWTSATRFPPIDFWANVLGDGDVMKYRRQGLYLHVTYGAIVGSFFPRIVQEIVPGLAGNLFAALPMSLVTATLYSMVVFLIGLVYARIGFFRMEFEPRVVGRFLASHVVFGLVLGLTTGLMQTVIRPLLGAACCQPWPIG